MLNCTVVASLAVAVLVVACGLLISRRKQHPFPPGPRGVPVLGNALQMPQTHGWVQFSKWAEEYGDVVHLTALGKHIIVLSSHQAISDLLIKRGANYSDRPVLPMANLAGFDGTWGLLQYGDRLRSTKRLAHKVLNPRACMDYVSIQDELVIQFLKRLSQSPQGLRDGLHWLVARYVLKIVYNHEVADPETDPVIQVNVQASNAFSAATNPASLVNVFPKVLLLPEWIPGTSFFAQARAWKPLARAMSDVPFDIVKNAMSRDMGLPQSHSFVARLLTGEDGVGVTPDEEDTIRLATGAMYGGAGETIMSTVRLFFLAMTLHPEVQRRAQAEITAFLESEGQSDRMLTLEDRPHLPYLDCVIKELFRMHPAAPLAVPHCSREEDVYRGWVIPAQTIVIPNIWKLTRDPALYPEPSAFKPERYLPCIEKNASGEPATKSSNGRNPDPQNFVFGFGRRECPGRHLASGLIWTTIANVLISYNILPIRDMQGNVIPPTVNFTGGTLSAPEDFPYTLQPRTERARDWMRVSSRERPQVV